MITIIGVGESTTNAGVTLTIPVPTNSPGDILLAVIGSGGASATSYTIPSGWNTLFQVSGGSVYYGDLRVFYRFASSEPSSYTWTASAVPTSGHKGAIISISGVDTEAPFSVYETALSSVATKNPHIAPSVDVPTDNNYILRLWSWRNIGGTITKPALDEIWVSLIGSRPSIVAMGAIQPSAGDSGTSELTSSATYRDATATIALNPAPAVSGGVKIYNGSGWVTPKVWDGSTWRNDSKVWDGSTWV